MPRRGRGEDQWGPWPDLVTAQRFFARLARGHSLQPVSRLNAAELGQWLQTQGLAPLVHACSRETWPELAQHLQSDVYAATGEAALHLKRLQEIVDALAPNSIPVVLLKGAALALLAYDDPAQRTMSDIDLWIRNGDMPEAVRLLHERGFKILNKQERPVELQRLGRGELQMNDPYGRLAELHWSPFKGWWLRRTAAVDEQALWERTEAAPTNPASTRQASPEIKADEQQIPASTTSAAEMVRLLAPEDMMIHLAVHMVVNHQFGLNSVRTLVDMARMSHVRQVRWALVEERARKWRLGTAVWLALHLLQALTGMTGAEPALRRLRPSRLRRSLLQRFVSPATLLGATDLRRHKIRYLLLLLMVDRPVDMVRVVVRTLWPEQEWLEARYGKETSHRQHLWNVLRHGEI